MLSAPSPIRGIYTSGTQAGAWQTDHGSRRSPAALARAATPCSASIEKMYGPGKAVGPCAVAIDCPSLRLRQFEDAIRAPAEQRGFSTPCWRLHRVDLMRPTFHGEPQQPTSFSASCRSAWRFRQLPASTWTSGRAPGTFRSLRPEYRSQNRWILETTSRLSRLSESSRQMRRNVQFRSPGPRRPKDHANSSSSRGGPATARDSRRPCDTRSPRTISKLRKNLCNV